MNVVAKDARLTSIIKVSSSVNDIAGFHEEVNFKKKRDTEIQCIEISYDGNIYKKQLQFWTNWYGVIKKQRLSLSYTPLYTIADIPVKLNKKFDIWDWDNMKDKPGISYKRDFTLIEILHAIYNDISFHGGPKDRDKFKK